MKDYACCPHSPSERGGRKQDLEGTPCCSPPALPLCCGTLVPSPQKWSIPCGIQLQNHTPNQLDSQSRAQKSVRTTWPGDSLQDGWSAFCIFFLYDICLFMCWVWGAHATAHVWRSESNMWELILFLYHVDRGDQTRVVRLGAGTLTPWANLPK